MEHVIQGVYGIGVVFRDEHRGLKGAIAIPQVKNLSLRSIEALALLHGLQFAIHVGFKNLEIKGKVKDVTRVQTLLFSATLPSWGQNISRRFLKSDKKTTDLVGNEKMKASIHVRHIVLPYA
ncbi:nucleolar RNA helicase 2-B isoform X1 [Rosa chinensis]|uniref:nucleolar RNA helicase 2-B isoform X1 n=1 Tax=Rosa chinensis TaxID=74649 RepID=UPI000D08C6D2|nr:nucleolar RNA helicase 2-B isoform X1 [Rosa chinensis]